MMSLMPCIGDVCPPTIGVRVRSSGLRQEIYSGFRIFIASVTFFTCVFQGGNENTFLSEKLFLFYSHLSTFILIDVLNSRAGAITLPA
jgi:hypothetical protein